MRVNIDSEVQWVKGSSNRFKIGMQSFDWITVQSVKQMGWSGHGSWFKQI